jgi:carboxypeptidase PM20D1
VVLLAHQDVVPVEPGTESSWEHSPFAGDVADGFVWGRGALDDKLNLFGQLEAAEALLHEGGVRPRRTILFGFGHDEELGGPGGASRIAALLASRGVKPLLVLDEGGSILQGVVPGVEAPVAAVGISEKGYLSLELEAEGQGGHSSMPSPESAIGILAKALRVLEQTPMPARLDGASRAMLEDGVGPEAGFPYRLVYANLWLFGPVLERVLARMPSASAILRTTTALTQLSAGLKDNVIPSKARAVLNFRILPGDSIEKVRAHVVKTVNDPRIAVRALPRQREPSPLSRSDGEGWELLARSIREVRPDAVVAPYLMLAGTDSRHFRGLTENVYRFMPLRLTLDDTKRIHGTNERVAVEEYADLVRSYRRLLENAAR